MTQYIFIFFSVVCHELAHMAVLSFFGLKTEKLRITPLGCAAYIKNLGSLSSCRKVIALMAGPLTNAVIGLACLLIFKDRFVFFRNAQFVLAAFNLLPAYPLDGGGILVTLLSSKFGLLTSNKIVYRFSQGCSALFFILGVLQAALYLPNITLLCMAAFTYTAGKEIYLSTIIDYYQKLYTNRH